LATICPPRRRAHFNDSLYGLNSLATGEDDLAHFVGCCGENRGTTVLRDDRSGGEGPGRAARNVLGQPLEICSIKPMTGFYRDGCCNTGRQDIGNHTVCAVMTSAFLEFSKSRGNDLSTPLPEFGFPGLKPGDRWCLCAARWQEALEANQAPRVVLRATHEGALAHCALGDLKRFAVDLA
jgi:uncharacterized protein (DUF2237 family)